MAQDRDLMAELDIEITWWPGTNDDTAEPGMKIGGTILDILELEGNWGPYPVLELRTRDGELVRVSCARSVLKNEVHNLAPQVGDEIAIRYDGHATLRDGKTNYHKYTVRLARNTPAAPAPRGEARPASRVTAEELDARRPTPTTPATEADPYADEEPF
mgnify:CR=1 FL=1